MIRRWRLLKLRLREYILRADLGTADDLWADHERRYLNAINTHKARYSATLKELQQVRARIAMLERPEVLLRRTA